MPEGEGRVTLLSVELGTAAAPALVRWCTWQPPWGQWGHNDSYALLTPGGPVLVDPEEPAPRAAARLGRLLGRPPAAARPVGRRQPRAPPARRSGGRPVRSPAAPGRESRPHLRRPRRAVSRCGRPHAGAPGRAGLVRLPRGGRRHRRPLRP